MMENGTFVVILTLGLIVVGFGGYFLFSNTDQIPNGLEGAASDGHAGNSAVGLEFRRQESQNNHNKPHKKQHKSKVFVRHNHVGVPDNADISADKKLDSDKAGVFAESNENSWTGSKTALDSCPCKDPAWCNPITVMDRKEVFMFSLTPKHKQWQHYDWSKITTVVMVGYLDLDVVCLAHSHGARAITIGDVETSVLPNMTARSEWIRKQAEIVESNFLDGLNFDYEEAILTNETSLKEGYTALVEETVEAFKKINPHLMISVDVAWSPDCIDSRCYDYIGLAKAADLLFVMSYDERSQILGPCVAWANSAYNNTMYGLHRWIVENFPKDKLVLGLPWYGYIYPCTDMSVNGVCSIREVPFRGVNCSDAAGKEIDYSYIIELVKNSTTGKIVDQIAQSPFFNYKDPSSHQQYQIWYDDPASLTLKYNSAVTLDLRGVGVWNTESLDYDSSNPDQVKAVHDMWAALPDWKKL